MAVTVDPIPKSQPDNSKLNTFTGHTVTVTKHTAPRNSVGQMVVPTQQMKLNQILELMTSIPMSYGPGFYRFTVSDTGGTGDDVWMVKLGPDIQEGSSMASNVIPMGPGGQPQMGPGASSEGVRQIGPGYFYDENLGLLTTPWREIVQWRPGDTLPKPPTTPVAGAAAHATPWWQGLPQMQPGFPQQAGWGGYPAVNDDTKIRELEMKLADSERKREADENRAEIRRIADEAQKRAEAQEARFALMIEKLTAKTGPSESEQRLERELADQRRKAEEDRREDQRRTEMREMKENTDRMIRELTENKQDPMLPMIMQMMTGAQQQAQKTVEAIQASTATAAAATERGTQELVRQLSTSVMTPLQLVQLMQSAKGEGAEVGRLLLDGTKDMMAMQKDVYAQLLEVAGQSGQPAWVGLVQEAMSKIGTIGEAIAARQQQVPPPQPIPRAMPQPQQRMPAPAQTRAAIPSAPQIPTTAAEIRDQVAAQVGHLTPVPTPVVHAAPMNGASAGPSVAVQPTSTPTPAPSTPAPARQPRRKVKHRRGGRRAAAPVPTALDGIAPPADPKGYSIEELRQLPPEAIRIGIADKNDAVLFAAFLPYVQQLRANNLAPEAVAKYIMQARAAAVQNGAMMSPAIELILAEQLEVVTERLFPAAPLEYRAAVVQAMADAIGAENGDVEGDEDDEDDEGDDEGDDAQA